MEKINRRIERNGVETYTLKRVGFNSEGTLTIVCEDRNLSEVLFNFSGTEFVKLKEFLRRTE